MRPDRSTSGRRLLTVLAGVLVLKVTAGVIANYRDYLPPDFGNEFLHGRERQFLGAYPWAFYAHIVSGPIALLLGLILIGERFRVRFPAWHRNLGRAQVVCVLLLVAPSGLFMARFAAAGPAGGAGLAALAVSTAACASFGARSAIRRRFVDHRRWMWRCFLLLCSAVVLRLIGGFAGVVGVSAPWYDPAANWASWIAPIVAFEVRERLKRRPVLPRGAGSKGLVASDIPATLNTDRR
jgi:hypothetical protein